MDDMEDVDSDKNRLLIDVGVNEVDRSKAYGCKPWIFCSMCIDEARDESINLSIVESWKL